MSEPDNDAAKHQTKFSMIEAAAQIGVAKSTMHRYIKQGRVSAKALETGGYQIDASELFRAFPPGWDKKGGTAETPARDDAEPLPPGVSSPEADGRVGSLQTEVRLLREMLAQANLEHDRERRVATDTIEDLRKRLTQEGEERRALNARLLTYQTPPGNYGSDTVVPPTVATPVRRGLFGLFRRAS